MFYALSTNQEWVKEHVNLFVALAPIASMKNSKAVDPLSDILDTTWEALDFAKIYEVFRTKVKDEIISDLDSKLIAWTGVLKDLIDAVSDS
jgi:hypothetical protein